MLASTGLLSVDLNKTNHLIINLMKEKNLTKCTSPNWITCEININRTKILH